MSKQRGKISKTIGKIIDRIPRSVTVNISKISRQDSNKGKRILVIGGSRGIGLEIARSVSDDHAKVIITGRNEKTLKAASDIIGNDCKYIVHDNRNFNDIEDFYKNVVSVHGGIDAIVYNSGIHIQGEGFKDVTMSEYDEQFNTNLKAPYFILQKFIKEKKREEKLDIVIITSETAFFSDYMPYGLTKVALNSLVRGLAKKFYKNGIRVNGVAPGKTAVESVNGEKKGNLDEKDYSPGRWFVPEEIAEVVSYLLSDAANCISGEIITCAGGHQANIW